MADKIFSVALSLPALASLIAARLVWKWRDSDSNIQTSPWRKIATVIGLLSLTADVLLSTGYLLYKFASTTVKWSVFDSCSSVGGIACLVGILAAAAGKGAAVRLLLLFGCFGGMLFWYLTIGPPSWSLD
jgi:cytochrome b561